MNTPATNDIGVHATPVLQLRRILLLLQIGIYALPRIQSHYKHNTQRQKDLSLVDSTVEIIANLVPQIPEAGGRYLEQPLPPSSFCSLGFPNFQRKVIVTRYHDHCPPARGNGKKHPPPPILGTKSPPPPPPHNTHSLMLYNCHSTLESKMLAKFSPNHFSEHHSERGDDVNTKYPERVSLSRNRTQKQHQIRKTKQSTTKITSE